jgi:hypothetical protein
MLKFRWTWEVFARRPLNDSIDRRVPPPWRTPILSAWEALPLK